MLIFYWSDRDLINLENEITLSRVGYSDSFMMALKFFLFKLFSFPILLCSDVKDQKILVSHSSQSDNDSLKPLESLSSKQIIDQSSKPLLQHKVKLSLGKEIEYDPHSFLILSKLFKRGIDAKIAEFSYERHVQDPYDQVMNNLNASKDQRKELNFYSNNFLEKLVPIVAEKKSNLPMLNLFWKDLEKLLFKHILYLKRKMTSIANDKPKKLSNDIQSILSILREKLRFGIFFSFNLTTMNINDFVTDLLNSEFLEQFDRLSRCLVKALKRFYFPFITKNEDENEIKEIKKRLSCNDFKAEFFDGKTDNDLLLKFFMINYDSGMLIKACLESDIDSNYSWADRESKRSKIENVITELESKNIKYFINNFKAEYLSNLTMKFIYLNNYKILIKGKLDFYYFLERMENVKLFKRDIMESMIEFKDKNVNVKSDSNSFELHLKVYSKDTFNTIRERDLFEKCSELFNSESPKEISANNLS